MAASQERLERYLQQMDEMDAAELADASPSKGRVRDLAQKIEVLRERQARLETHRKALQESGEAQLSLTDPDARAMHSGTGVGVGYNVQIAVDTKHKLIAEQQVHSQVSDLGLLAETARAARTSLGVERIDAVADKEYFKVEDIAGCEAAGITPYVPKPRRSPARRSGRFSKERFRYDAGTDTYACPNGQQLKPLRGRRSFHFFLTDWIQEHARSELSSSDATTGWSGASESEDYRRRILGEARSRGHAPQGSSAGRFDRRRVLVATGAQTPDATPLLRRASV